MSSKKVFLYTYNSRLIRRKRKKSYFKANSFVSPTLSISGENKISNANSRSSRKRPANLTINSDFVYESPSSSQKPGEEAAAPATEEAVTPKLTNSSAAADNAFDFDLVAQQLAATTGGGSHEATDQLAYILDTFVECRCYEWAMVIALVSHSFATLGEIVRNLRDPASLPCDITKSLRKGFEQLDEWSQNEWYIHFQPLLLIRISLKMHLYVYYLSVGYREIIKKLIDVI